MPLTSKSLLLASSGRSSNKQRKTRLGTLFPCFCLGCLVTTQLTPKQFTVFSSSYLDALSDEHRGYQQEEHHHAFNNKNLLREHQIHLLNDKTMRLSPYVQRPWLDLGGTVILEQPTTKLILTDFAWNHPDQENVALTKYPRSLRSRELLQAYIDHPHFDPAFVWSDMVQGLVDFDLSLQYMWCCWILRLATRQTTQYIVVICGTWIP
jgi:hypothetical protein